MNILQRFSYHRPQFILWPIAFIALVVLLVLLFGCSPLTQTTRTEQVKQQQASTGASDAAVNIVAKAIEQPKPVPAVGTLSVSGEDNKVMIVSPTPTATDPDRRETRVEGRTGQTGATNEEYDHQGENSTRLTIIGYAVGLGLLVLVVFGTIAYIRRQSVAANLAWNELDRSLADKIQRARTRAATTADAMEMAKANAEVAELERERGIANAP